MSSEINITLEQGFSTPFEGRQLEIASARWQMIMGEEAGYEVPLRVMLTIELDAEQAKLFGELFEPVKQAQALGRTAYLLEAAPDVLTALRDDPAIRSLPDPGAWLSLMNAALMRLESYIYLASMLEPKA